LSFRGVIPHAYLLYDMKFRFYGYMPTRSEFPKLPNTVAQGVLHTHFLAGTTLPFFRHD